jgi:hypothetical protein
MNYIPGMFLCFSERCACVVFISLNSYLEIENYANQTYLKEQKYNQAKISNRASLRASEYVSADGKAIFNALFA